MKTIGLIKHSTKKKRIQRIFMNLLKKILGILLVIVMLMPIIFIAGCGGRSPKNEGENSGESTPTEQFLLAAPTGLVQDGNELTWIAVADAVGYVIYIGGIAAFDVYINVFNLDEMSHMIGEHSIRVRALGDGKTVLDSPLSSAITVVITATAIIPRLTAPTGLIQDGNELTWGVVAGAVRYAVYVGGIAMFDVDTNVFKLDKMSHIIGEHSIRIRALGDGNTFLNSVLSGAIAVTIEALELMLSHSPGFYCEPFDLSVTIPAFPDARIYWTIDGREPAPGASRVVRRDRLHYEYRHITVSGVVPDSGIMPVLDHTSQWRLTLMAAYSDVWYRRFGVRPATNADVLRGTAFRFRAFIGDRPVSDIVTVTYIVTPDAAKRFNNTPIISITADYDDFVYIYSNNFQNNSDFQFDPVTRRRIFNFEYFEFNGERYDRKFSVPGYTQIGGNWTRSFAQRTLNVNLRRAPLNETITHPVFEGLYDLRRFRLWNGGNSFMWDHMRDPFVQKASAGLTVPYADSQVAVKFVNGEYWGFTTIREHTSNTHFVETRMGVANGNVAIMDRSWRHRDGGGPPIFEDEVGEGGNRTQTLYNELINFIRTNPFPALNTDAMRERIFNEFFCQDNLMDYLIANTFFHNTDWPQNNVRFFRAINPVQGSNNPNNDGRWRFIFHDMDHAIPYWDRNHIYRTTFSRLYNPQWYAPEFNQIFRGLFNNRIFVEEFRARALYVLDNHYQSATLQALYTEYVDRYRPLLEDMYTRFLINANAGTGFPHTVQGNIGHFEWHVANTRNFLNVRHGHYINALNHIVNRVPA